MIKKIISTLLILLIFFGTQVSFARVPKYDSRDLRALQSRYVDVGDSEIVWQAVITTLYDSGFEIVDLDKNLGILRAKKFLKLKYTNKRRLLGWSTWWAMMGAYTAFSYGTTVGSMIDPSRRIVHELRDKNLEINANVYVSKCTENMHIVRFVFVEKILLNADGYSFTKQAPMRILRVYKPKIYEEFYSQLGNNILKSMN